MSNANDVLPTLRFVLVRASGGELDSYALADQRLIEFSPDDEVIAEVQVDLSPAEQESFAVVAKELPDGLNGQAVFQAIAEKVFLAGYQAGARTSGK